MINISLISIVSISIINIVSITIIIISIVSFSKVSFSIVGIISTERREDWREGGKTARSGPQSGWRLFQSPDPQASVPTAAIRVETFFSE